MKSVQWSPMAMQILVYRIFFVSVLAIMGCQIAVAQPNLGLSGLQPDDDPRLVRLGQQLFFDRRLSFNNTLSCAMCHIPEQGFAQNQLQTSVGFEGQVTERNAPTLLNVGLYQTLFYDGREFSLENQIWSPLLATREMANPSMGWVIQQLQNIGEYAQQFEYFPEGLTPATLGQALAAYQRSLIAANSPFDRWYFLGDESAVSDSVKRGFAHFKRLGCTGCHLVSGKEAKFTDQQFHNTGLGYHRSMGNGALASSFVVGGSRIITTMERFDDRRSNDLGRYEATQDPQDRWKFRTPSLRNVALTAPYMHDGTLPTLRSVIDFYDQGGFEAPGRDPRIRKLSLTADHKAELEGFLRSLTSDEVDHLIKLARGETSP